MTPPRIYTFYVEFLLEVTRDSHRILDVNFGVAVVERGSSERRLTSVPMRTSPTGRPYLISPGWRTLCLGTLCREVSNGLAHIFL